MNKTKLQASYLSPTLPMRVGLRATPTRRVLSRGSARRTKSGASMSFTVNIENYFGSVGAPAWVVDCAPGDGWEEYDKSFTDEDRTFLKACGISTENL